MRFFTALLGILSLVVVKKSIPAFNYYKHLFGVEVELLRHNSDIFYNIEIDIWYPYDMKQCNGPNIMVTDRQRKYPYSFELDQKGLIWRAAAHNQSQSRYLITEQQNERHFKWLFRMNDLKAEISWNGGKATFLHAHENEEFIFVTVQETCKLDRVTINEYLSKESRNNMKEIQYLTKPEESVAEMISDERVQVVEKFSTPDDPAYFFYYDKQDEALLNIFGVIYAFLVPAATIATVLATVMIAIEVRIFASYQSAKNRPVKLVITKDFLEQARREREMAKQRYEQKRLEEKNAAKKHSK